MVGIGVLASGSGTNFGALLEADLGPGEIRVLITNKSNAGARTKATAGGIPEVVVSHRDYDSRSAFDARMVEVLRAHDVEWVVLAGFMRLVTPVFLDAFPSRVVNIHPALLPSFPGVDAQRQAFDAGVKITGCTVHLVDAGMDTGPVLAQSAVRIRPTDDLPRLQKRILAEEHRLLPAVVRLLCEGRLREADGRPYLDVDGLDYAGALVSPPIHGVAS